MCELNALAEGSCPGSSLRQLLRYNPRDGIERCQYCIFDSAACIVSCGTCRQNATTWGPATTLDLNRCTGDPGDLFVRRRTGELWCKSYGA